MLKLYINPANNTDKSAMFSQHHLEAETLTQLAKVSFSKSGWPGSRSLASFGAGYEQDRQDCDVLSRFYGGSLLALDISAEDDDRKRSRDYISGFMPNLNEPRMAGTR